MLSPRFIRFLVVGLTASLCPVASAVVLDWSSQSWTPGALTQSFNVDPAVPGTNLTMTFSGDTAYFQPSFSQPGVPTPAVTQTFQGGFATLQNSLEIRVDFTANTQQVTLTIDFAAIYSAGVNNVSFTLFDIDSQTTYKDQIRSIWATDITGAQIAPIISGVGTAATVTGAGLNQTIDGIANSSDTGAGSDAGNATISFGSTPIRSLTFTYGNVTGTQADPTTQKIGLYNLSYSPVPEMNPAWLGAGTVLIGIGYKLRRGGRTTAPVT